MSTPEVHREGTLDEYDAAQWLGWNREGFEQKAARFGVHPNNGGRYSLPDLDRLRRQERLIEEVQRRGFEAPAGAVLPVEEPERSVPLGMRRVTLELLIDADRGEKLAGYLEAATRGDGYFGLTVHPEDLEGWSVIGPAGARSRGTVGMDYSGSTMDNAEFIRRLNAADRAKRTL